MQTETFNPEVMGMLVVSFRGVNLSQGVQDEMPQILVVKVSFRITGVQIFLYKKTAVQTCLSLSKWFLEGIKLSLSHA